MAFAFASPSVLKFSLATIAKKQIGSAAGVFYMVSIISGTLGVALAGVLIANPQHIQHHFNHWLMVLNLSVCFISLLSLGLTVFMHKARHNACLISTT